MKTISFLFFLNFVISSNAQNKPLNLDLPPATVRAAMPAASGGSTGGPIITPPRGANNGGPGSTPGSASGPTWFEEQEQKRKNRKLKCVAFFKQNLPKIETKDVPNYCSTESVVDAANDTDYSFNSAQYLQCVNINATLAIPEEIYIIDCSIRYKISSMLMEKFPLCISQLSPEFGKLPSYRACQDGTFLSDLRGDDFKICVQNMKYLKQSTEKTLSKCSSFSDRNRIISKRFVECIDIAQSTGISNNGIYEFCNSENNLSAVTSHSFATCTKTLDQAGIKYKANQFGVCANQDSQDIAIRNPKCFVDSILSTYKNYFLFSAITSANGYSSDRNLYYFLNRDCRNEVTYQTYPQNPYLNLVKELNIHTYEGMIYNRESVQVGGFSALNYDAQTETLYMLSDETFMSTKLPPRMYVYQLTKDLELRDQKVFPFTFHPPAGEQEPDIDPEGLARLSNGDFIVSSEIGANEFRKLENKKTLITNLNIFNSNGSYVSSIALPENYRTKYVKHESTSYGNPSPPSRVENSGIGGNNGIMRMNGNEDTAIDVGRSGNRNSNAPTNGNGIGNGNGNGKSNGSTNSPYNPPTVTFSYQLTAGLEFNKSIESLSVSPDEKFLFIANEGALVQDQQVRGKCRESNNNSNNGNWNNGGSGGYWQNGIWHTTQSCGKVVRIVRYANENSSPNSFIYSSEYKYELEPEVDNGVSEILAVTSNKLLVLERSWDPSRQKVIARIYKVELKEESLITADVKTATKLEKIPALGKTLVLDFDTIIYKLSPGFRNIDNFEGMAFGPVLKSGKRSLLLVTDNNFSTKQRTVFLVFEAQDRLFE